MPLRGHLTRRPSCVTPRVNMILDIPATLTAGHSLRGGRAPLECAQWQAGLPTRPES
jgi:hypothetical protein